MEDYSAPAKSSFVGKIVAAFCAIGIVGGLSYGYMRIRHRFAKDRVEAQITAQEAKKPIVHETVLSISENEVQPKAGRAIVSGTVRNVGKSEVRDLVIEFELTQRKNAEKERKTTSIKDSIASEGEAHYSLTLPANTYRTVRILRIYSEQSPTEDLAFNTTTGEQRAKQPPPGDYASAPSKRRANQSSDGFLNRPDQPVSLP